MPRILDVLATSLQKFLIGGTTGVTLKNNAANLIIRNAADSADANVTAATVNVSGDNFILNSDATNSSSDWSISVARPTSGMTSAYTLTLPINPGTNGQVLTTNGSGQTSWVSSGSSADTVKTDSTTLNFNTASPLTLFTLPSLAQITCVRVIVDTVFNGTGTPTVSIGISGAPSKYLSTTDVDLKTQAVYEFYPGIAPNPSSESLIATYSPASSPSAGSARIQIDYVIPS